MNAQARLIDLAGLDALIGALRDAGHTVIGPRVRDEAIVYDEIDGIADLPDGITEEQEAGHYRLRPRDDRARFGYTVGPHAWKRFLHPPAHRLFTLQRSAAGFDVIPGDPAPLFAFLGVRACDLHAIAIQDRVLVHGPTQDPVYADRRRAAFLIAVQCGGAAPTCFCTSMNTGPRAHSGFDLALTELVAADRHDFLVQIGSERGAALLARVPTRPAQPADEQASLDASERAAAQITRRLPMSEARALLADHPEHPRFAETATRCLACANCTMVCPTCFCVTVDDVPDLSMTTSERRRTWDSCFNAEFTLLHGGSARSSTAARYRQWITHKLSSWWEQFGSSGCVGCGRCIAWCPPGIDITEEVAAIQSSTVAAQTGAST